MSVVQCLRRTYLNASKYPACLSGLIEAMRQACDRTQAGPELAMVVYDRKRYRVLPISRKLKEGEVVLFVATACGVPDGSEADHKFLFLQAQTYHAMREKYLAMAGETAEYIERLAERLMESESFPPTDPFDKPIRDRKHYADQYFCNLLLAGEVLDVKHPQAAIFVGIERFIEEKSREVT